MATPDQRPDPIDAIRDPEVIRLRLARAVREADILRRLLKVSQSAAALDDFERGHAEGPAR